MKCGGIGERRRIGVHDCVGALPLPSPGEARAPAVRGLAAAAPLSNVPRLRRRPVFGFLYRE